MVVHFFEKFTAWANELPMSPAVPLFDILPF